MEMNPPNDPHMFQVSLKIILEDERGRILGLKNTPDSSVADFFDLPGGRINSDELTASPMDIIAREMAEEVGPEVRYEVDAHPAAIGRHDYYSQQHGRENNVLLIFFRAGYLGGEIRASEEHIGYEWIDPATAQLDSYFTGGFLEGIKGYLECK